jgi:hypothetical protein
LRPGDGDARVTHRVPVACLGAVDTGTGALHDAHRHWRPTRTKHRRQQAMSVSGRCTLFVLRCHLRCFYWIRSVPFVTYLHI